MEANTEELFPTPFLLYWNIVLNCHFFLQCLLPFFCLSLLYSDLCYCLKLQFSSHCQPLFSLLNNLLLFKTAVPIHPCWLYSNLCGCLNPLFSSLYPSLIIICLPLPFLGYLMRGRKKGCRALRYSIVVSHNVFLSLVLCVDFSMKFQIQYNNLEQTFY